MRHRRKRGEWGLRGPRVGWALREVPIPLSGTGEAETGCADRLLVPKRRSGRVVGLAERSRW